jgi:hypothetical protein
MSKINDIHVKPQYFLAVAVVSTVVAVVALRANNEHMITLRQAVYTDDKNNTDINQPLKELQNYVTTHMNTNLSSGPNAPYPPVQLKYTYERLVAANGSAVTSANNQIYTEAQKACEQQNSADFSGRNRVPCIEQYVKSHNAAMPPVISDSLYKFSFLSPTWSPDLAGWSLVLAALSYVLCIVALIYNYFTKPKK